MKVGDRKNVMQPGVDGISGGATPADERRPLDATGDRVRVSQVARALARLIAQTAGAEPGGIRPEKVAPLQAAVARGEYRVDLQATARSFLREVIGDLAR